jgi:hypothetical protein
LNRQDAKGRGEERETERKIKKINVIRIYRQYLTVSHLSYLPASSSALSSSSLGELGVLAVQFFNLPDRPIKLGTFATEPFPGKMILKQT